MTDSSRFGQAAYGEVALRSEPKPVPGMRFTWPTVIAAIELLQLLDSSHIDLLALRLRLNDHVPSGDATKAEKCYALGAFVDRSGSRTVDTLEGSMSLSEAIVREATKVAQQDSPNSLQASFVRGVERDGYVLFWNDDSSGATLRSAFPDEIQLPETDDEVRRLLRQFEFTIPLQHLDEAIGSHTTGSWGATNGQLRSFFEGLLDDIASRLRPNQAPQLPSSENRRALLAQIGFLSTARSEWAMEGNSYVKGLYKMLHTEGAHPGISDEETATFRLQIVLVTARAFLRRLDNRPNPTDWP